MKLEQEILRYSTKNGYAITSYTDINCSCGSSEFHLYSDDNEGGAFVVCSKCRAEQDIENSRGYIKEALNNICNCDNDKLKIGVGKAYYPDSNDNRWVYIGAECGKCGLLGVYVDWKEN